MEQRVEEPHDFELGTDQRDSGLSLDDEGENKVPEEQRNVLPSEQDVEIEAEIVEREDPETNRDSGYGAGDNTHLPEQEIGDEKVTTERQRQVGCHEEGSSSGTTFASSESIGKTSNVQAALSVVNPLTLADELYELNLDGFGENEPICPGDLRSFISLLYKRKIITDGEYRRLWYASDTNNSSGEYSFSRIVHMLNEIVAGSEHPLAKSNNIHRCLKEFENLAEDSFLHAIRENITQIINDVEPKYILNSLLEQKAISYRAYKVVLGINDREGRAFELIHQLPRTNAAYGKLKTALRDSYPDLCRSLEDSEGKRIEAGWFSSERADKDLEPVKSLEKLESTSSNSVRIGWSVSTSNHTGYRITCQPLKKNGKKKGISVSELIENPSAQSWESNILSPGQYQISVSTLMHHRTGDGKLYTLSSKAKMIKIEVSQGKVSFIQRVLQRRQSPKKSERPNDDQDASLSEDDTSSDDQDDQAPNSA
ncbi:uncharacterized protein [Ptychodera flava]|uniref:uncharacterized protein n=1 Tax=Ptychodera flava TaxID=63121 RepID=UPI00396A8C2C